MRRRLPLNALIPLALSGLGLLAIAHGQIVVGPTYVPADDGLLTQGQMLWSSRGKLFSFFEHKIVPTSNADAGFSFHEEVWRQMSGSILPGNGKYFAAELPQNGFTDQLGATVGKDDAATALAPNRGYVPQLVSDRQVSTYTKAVTGANKTARQSGLQQFQVKPASGEQMYDVKVGGQTVGYAKLVGETSAQPTLHWAFNDGECVKDASTDTWGCIRPGNSGQKKYTFHTRNTAVASATLTNSTYVKSIVTPLYPRLIVGSKALSWNGNAFSVVSPNPAHKVTDDAWRFERLADGGAKADTLIIRWKTTSKKVLTVQGKNVLGISDLVGGNTAQQWKLEQVAGGGYKIVSASDASKALYWDGTTLTLKQGQASTWSLGID
ncbi:MAG: RICIN domain-containing protein [Bradymonadia bacterium]